MDFPSAEAGASPADRAGTKFTYPGGSRPLEGYTIKRGVGQGGFGEIYYAVSDAGKEVALKLIRRNLDVELRGIRHCLNLKHPNLLDLYDIRQDEHGDTWVVMEFVAGQSLEDALIAHPNGLPVDQAVAWFHGVAAGVAYLHDRGIVHRDLKPGNIFSNDGLVKVGDYGLSKFISCSRRSGHTESIGTVHYMAPEVANGRYGKEIDVYAMGIILYEMLTGRVPFDGESIGEVLMKHLTAKPDVSMLPEPFRGVIARALEKDPAKRFASMSEMLVLLPAPAQLPPGATRLPQSDSAVVPPIEFPRRGAAEPAMSPQVIEEEPIARAVRDAWHKLHDTWTQANLPLPVRIIVLVAFAILCVSTMFFWLGPAIVLCFVYLGYRVVRMIVMSTGSPAARPQWKGPPPTAPPATVTPGVAPPTPPAATHAPPRPRPSPYEQTVRSLAMKPAKERLVELLGSLLVGALAVVVVCVAVVLLYSFHRQPGAEEEMQWWSQCGWLVLVGIAGTWTVLIVTKFWEGVKGESTPRRFVSMIVGLLLGIAAFAAAQSLLVQFTQHPSFPKAAAYALPRSFYDAGNQPLVMAFLACFGTLFFLVRWWLQTDPLRPTRVSLWALACTIVAAGIVAEAWHFPQPWLPMVAGTISVAVQLASPWIAHKERFRRKAV